MTAQPPRFRRYSANVRAAMLVEAGLACLARGGISAFTVENICRQAGASRGLIAHHFGSKDGLLSAVYAAAYRPILADLAGEPALGWLVGRIFAPEHFNRDSLNVWLALWGEVAANPALRAEHRIHYTGYRNQIAAAIGRFAGPGLHRAEADELAMSFIALVDGLWLEQCLDPQQVSPERAKAVCLRMLEQILGPL